MSQALAKSKDVRGLTVTLFSLERLFKEPEARKVARGGGELNVAGTINEESSSMSERLLRQVVLYVKRHLTKECPYWGRQFGYAQVIS